MLYGHLLGKSLLLGYYVNVDAFLLFIFEFKGTLPIVVKILGKLVDAMNIFQGSYSSYRQVFVTYGYPFVNFGSETWRADYGEFVKPFQAVGKLLAVRVDAVSQNHFKINLEPHKIEYRNPLERDLQSLQRRLPDPEGIRRFVVSFRQ